MKKLLVLFALSVLATACSKDTLSPSPHNWVDLGLPSGTLWDSIASKELFSRTDAMNTYGSHIPTKEQWEELIEYCEIKHIFTNAYTYKVTGHNGRSIFLPASGLLAGKDGWRHGEGYFAFYWTSTPAPAGRTWYVFVERPKNAAVETRFSEYQKYAVALVSHD